MEEDTELDDYYGPGDCGYVKKNIQVRHKIFDLIKYNALEGIKAYIDENPDINELLFGDIFIKIPTGYAETSRDLYGLGVHHYNFRPYSYALYLEKFDVLEIFIETLSQRHRTTPLTSLLKNSLVSNHDIREIKLLLKFGANINDYGSNIYPTFSFKVSLSLSYHIDDWTPILYSTFSLTLADYSLTKNRIDVLYACEKLCADFELSSILDRPHILHLATMFGANHIVEKLLTPDVDLNQKIEFSSMPFPFQAVNDSKQLMTPLEGLLQSPLVEHFIIAMSDNSRKMHLPMNKSGIKSNYSAVINLFLDHDVDCTLKNQLGENLLHILSCYGIDSTTIERLLKQGLNINQQTLNGYTALHAAAKTGHAKTVKALLKLGADPRLKDHEFNYPINFSPNDEIADILKPHYKMSELAYRKISYLKLDALSKTIFDRYRVQKKQLQNALDTNDVTTTTDILNDNPDIVTKLDEYGCSLLADGLNRGCKKTEVIKLLLDAKADPNGRTDDGLPALTIAIRKNISIEIIQLLLDDGAEPMIANSPRSPVFEACTTNRLDVLQALEAKGADLHQTLRNGYHSLYAACETNSTAIDVALYLIDTGAKITTPYIQTRHGIITKITITDLLIPRLAFNISAPTQPYQEENSLEISDEELPADSHELYPLSGPAKILRMIDFDLVGFKHKKILQEKYECSLSDLLASDDDLNDILTDRLKLIGFGACEYEDDNNNNNDIPLPPLLEENQFRRLPLHIAARYGAIKNIKTCLDHGMDMNAVDEGGMSALHWAVHHKQKAAIELLIASGANTELKSYDGDTHLELGYKKMALENVCNYLTPSISLEYIRYLAPKNITPFNVNNFSMTYNWPKESLDKDIFIRKQTTEKKEVSSLSIVYSVVNHFLGTASTDTAKEPKKILLDFIGPRLTVKILSSDSKDYSSLPVKLSSNALAFSFESLVRIDANNIAVTLEKNDLCKSALKDLANHGFRGMTTSEFTRDNTEKLVHAETPGLKRLYDQHTKISTVGIFVRSNLTMIKKARKEALFKALFKHWIFKADVESSKDTRQLICDKISDHDIPQDDNESSALMKMFPGTTGKYFK